VIRSSAALRIAVALIGLATIGVAKASYDVGSAFTLAPPPAPGSAAEREDFRELLRLQKERSGEDCDAAGRQSAMTGLNLVGPRQGVLSKAEFDALGDTIGELLDTVGDAAAPFKKEYARVRPYEANPKIKPCIRLPGGQTSYPSAHAASGVVLGHFLKLVFPERAEEIEAMTWQIGQNRLVGGVHHPSDVEAGRELGEQIWEALETNSGFKRDLRGAKAALR
jgi:acid phosphatase (class A)